VALLAGCGGHRASVSGKAVFSSSCAGCHTLTGHDTDAPGGDLAIAKLSAADIASFVRVMPVHLTASQEAAVAAYVHLEAGRR